MKRLSNILLLVALLAASQSQGLACSVCFGESGSPMALGLAWGVVALFAVVAAVLTGLISFFLFLARKARQNPLQESGPAMAVEQSSQVSN